MAVKLLFFAQCSDWVHRKEADVEVREPESVERLLGRMPELALILDRRNILRVAINQEFSHFDAEVNDGDEVAFLPPVSGG